MTARENLLLVSEEVILNSDNEPFPQPEQVRKEIVYSKGNLPAKQSVGQVSKFEVPKV